jgi:hypothetical protein
MKKGRVFAIKDEVFELEIDGINVNLTSYCRTPQGTEFKHILDYEAKNEARAEQMYGLLNEGNVFIDGGRVTT